MTINCEIKFDHNPYGIYISGQTLSGHVEIRLDKTKKVRGLSLKISGFALCKWSDRDETNVQKNRRSRAVQFMGREDYLSSTTYLLGSEEGIQFHIFGEAKTTWWENISRFVDGKHQNEQILYQATETYLDTKTYFGKANDGNQLELLPGIHTYSFQCALPHMLPTSFEGTYGHIRYTIRLVLERPWKFDQTYKIAFTVLKQLDLNYESPLLRIPSQMEITKSFWCGPCSSGPLSIVANIAQSGFVAGQMVVVNTDVANMSNVAVSEMKFLLRKIIRYYSQTPTSKTKEEIVNVIERRTGGVAKTDHGRFQVSLPIPSIPPSNVTLCRVIQISYDVRIEAKMSPPHINPYVCIPITIGTIPLNRNIPDPKVPNISAATIAPIVQQPLPVATLPVIPSIIQPLPATAPPMELSPEIRSSAIQSDLPIISPIQNRFADEYPDIPPPSYEESVYGSRRIDDEEDVHAIGKPSYVPRYPVYHFEQFTLNNEHLQQIQPQPPPRNKNRVSAIRTEAATINGQTSTVNHI